MKMLYLADARIPTEKAHGLQIMKMCESFSKTAVDLELITPRRFQSERMKEVGDPYEFYGIEKNFEIKKIFSADLMPHSPAPKILLSLLFWLRTLVFGLFSTAYTVSKRPDVVYTRNPLICFLLSNFKELFGSHLFYEAHRFPETAVGKRMFRSMSGKLEGLIVITRKLKEFYEELGFPSEKILVAPSGVDLKKFGKIDKEEARKESEIPLDKKIALYTGHLYKWKGAHVLAKSTKYLPDDYLIYLVGGTSEDLREFKKFLKKNDISRVVLTGYVAPTLIPKYLAAADVLVCPNTSKDKISRYYTSPIKIFEYMASGRPIVASDLPSIREVLNEENAILVEPDKPKILAKSLKRVGLGEAQEGLSEKAYEKVKQYSWEKRAEELVEAFKWAKMI